MSIKFHAAALSDIGPRKGINQDSYFFAIDNKSQTSAGIFAVADGVSGSAHGEVASRLCMEKIEFWWKNIFPTLNYERSKVIPSAAELVIGINKTVCETKFPDGGRSATTLTMLLLVNDQWYTFNAGDSRIYRLKKGIMDQIEQITEDQSCLVEKEQEDGDKYLKSVLTSCIGGRNAFSYKYSSGPIRSGDRFFLCSDGIYKTVPLQQIKKILGSKKESAARICELLIGKALNNGETDNITAITVFSRGREDS